VSQSVHVKYLVPIRIQSLFDDRGRFCLLATDGSDGEWIREA
jgi:hypothetical protein